MRTIRLIASCGFLLGALVSAPVVARAADPIASPADPAAVSGVRPFLHPLFSQGMVLQRDVPMPVWGWTTPGAPITVTLGTRQGSAKADAAGRWQVDLPPAPAGGPFTLTVDGPQRATVADVLIGEVWICSGQSNMGFSLDRAENGAAEIAASANPSLRLFQVPKKTSFTPQDTVAAAWTPCEPATVRGFSAVAYFFGRKLNQELGVPVGLIATAWGGTPAEAWTSADALRRVDGFPARLDRLADLLAPPSIAQHQLDWYTAHDPGTIAGWQRPDADDTGWKERQEPEKKEGKGPGVLWLRKAFDAPAAWHDAEVRLDLGPLQEADTTWVNGVQVGYTAGSAIARTYRVPSGTITAGRNVIVVRTYSNYGGTFTGKPEQLRIGAANGEPVTLSGAWKTKVSVVREQVPAEAPLLTDAYQNLPTTLYNGMLLPLAPYAARGAIWYQGENNTNRAWQYRLVLPALIGEWRRIFGRGDGFAFHIVQLANHIKGGEEPRDHAWAVIRESQALVAKATPNAGLAVAIDIGNPLDIHPKNKLDVGLRLALSALGVTYGRAIEYSGPWYEAMHAEGKAIRLTFTHAGRGLVAKGGTLTGFAIAGADQRFVWADAKIDGNAVLVSAAQVPQPVAVRYAWDSSPTCSLTNAEGLPAVPFRTDDWPVLTQDLR